MSRKLTSPQCVERLEKIRRIVKAGKTTNSEIALKLGISKALVHHYTVHLRNTGEIALDGVLQHGNRCAFVWRWIDKGDDSAGKPAAFSWWTRPVQHSPNGKPIPRLTNWVGGNPYDRLAA